MLKKRIVATVLVRHGAVVQSIGFRRYLPVGRPNIAVKFLTDWGVDEIILLDISATERGGGPNEAEIRRATAHARVPLTVGGGISEIDHIARLMHSGADKVSLNQAILHQPQLIGAAAHTFGSQCIVASIDAQSTETGHRVYDYRSRELLDMRPADLARRAEDAGAGEILVNSVDRDGSYQGFDFELIDGVCEAVSVPVICSGGAGCPQHFVEVFQRTAVSAAAAANFFHFTEHSVTTTKAQVASLVGVRHESHADYGDSSFDGLGRLQKKQDEDLEKMLFFKVEKEVI